MAVEPSFVLEHFPDIQCPMVNVLTRMNHISNDGNNTPEKLRRGGKQECTLLAEVIHPLTRVYRALAFVSNYPKMVIREKEQENSLSPKMAEYYERNVNCTVVLYLCAFTKGQARNVTRVLQT